MPPDPLPVGPEDDDATRPAGYPRPAPDLDDDRTVIVTPGAGPRAHPVVPPTQPPSSAAGGLADGLDWAADEGRAWNDPGAPTARAPVTVPGVPPQPQLARFTNGVVLGSGRRTTVFKAHDPTRGTDIAIKLLNPMLAQDEGCRARFLRAARATWGLSHPNIAAVQEVGEFEGRPYVAMDLIDGESLAERMERTASLPLRDAVRIATEVASALEAAHARGLLHGELGAAAVLLKQPHGEVKVTDFGMADVDEGLSGYTYVGGAEEPLPNLSPEQARGEAVDARSDIFAAGTLLYRMLASRPAFTGATKADVIRAIVQSQPQPLSALRPDAPVSLQQLVDRCLAKAPADRFASAGELVRALQAVGAELDAATVAVAAPHAAAAPAAAWASAASIAPGRFAVAIAGIVALVGLIFCGAIAWMQSGAAANQAVDQGAMLARFFARQYAGAALAEEWEVIEVAIQEITKGGDVARITVVDLDGIVRASSETPLVGQPAKAAAGNAVAQRPGPVTVRREASAAGPALAFETPLLFQDKTVGRVEMSLSEAVLSRGQGGMGWLVAWAVVATLAAGLGAYVLARRR